ncbi:hypothetical protein QJQ45_002243 [Haematococcus lacustris]|nr:hypothetical protein QJQ45_002243 [Haematococcus lacustris]
MSAATEAAAATEAELEEARSQLRSCQSVNMRTATNLQVCQEQLHQSQQALQQSENERCASNGSSNARRRMQSTMQQPLMPTLTVTSAPVPGLVNGDRVLEEIAKTESRVASKLPASSTQKHPTPALFNWVVPISVERRRSDKRLSLLLGRIWLIAFIYFNKRVLERKPKPQPEAE